MILTYYFNFFIFEVYHGKKASLPLWVQKDLHIIVQKPGNWDI